MAGLSRTRTAAVTSSPSGSPGPGAPVAGEPRYALDSLPDSAVIKVVGVGGGGGNAVNRMIATGLRGVEFIAVNTDHQVLRDTHAARAVSIGSKLTRGLGAGGNPQIGQSAAEESWEELRDALAGADMVFIAAGLGGGTGTGAAPVVGAICQEIGALTVGVVTTPFAFEGARRRRLAVDGLARMREVVDTLITVPNDRLLLVSGKHTSLDGAFALADDVLRMGIQGITDTIVTPGLINLDFADVQSVLRQAGSALMGIGQGSGPARAREAVEAALSSSLLGVTIERARSVLFTIRAGANCTMTEIGEAAEMVGAVADADAQIIFGAIIDDSMMDDMQVTVIAAGVPERGSSASGAFSPGLAHSAMRVDPAPPPLPAAKPAMPEPAPPAPPVYHDPIVDTVADPGAPARDTLSIPTFLRLRKPRR